MASVTHCQTMQENFQFSALVLFNPANTNSLEPNILLYSCTNVMCAYLSVASQIWNFAVYFPLMIGDKIPEEEPLWECFLLLLEITKYCTARVTSPAAAAYVAALVDQHHRDFKRCYPHTPLTPKMVHFPGQMLK